jgi:hypothetical protein
MAALGSKLRSVQGGMIAFWCPGCDSSRVVGVKAPATLIWGWNGDAVRPTFTPSILVTYNGKDAGQQREGADRAPPAVCHSFVCDGAMQFLADCTHALGGKTVPLPDFPADHHTD